MSVAPRPSDKPPLAPEDQDYGPDEPAFWRQKGRRTLLWMSPKFRAEVMRVCRTLGVSRKRVLSTLAVDVEAEYRGRVAEVWLKYEESRKTAAMAQEANEFPEQEAQDGEAE